MTLPIRDKYCFTCREKTLFQWQVLHPAKGNMMDSPEAVVQCAKCRTQDSDLFPGNYRHFVDPYNPYDKKDVRV